MLNAYALAEGRLVPLPGNDLSQAVWIDLYRPLDSQVAQVAALGVEVPTLADMEEIEISNRLAREGDTDQMTAVLPGELPDGVRVAMPVAFILSPRRLVTVRHHAPRPFKTFPERADRSTLGCTTPERVFVGLIEEIVARLADILEGSGRVLDETTARVFAEGGNAQAELLQTTLAQTGREAELIARVRLGLLSLERIVAFYTVTADKRSDAHRTKPVAKSIQRDIQALEVHADHLSARIGLTVEATMGMINLQQNNIVRILSVIAALFLPPTLIGTIYGMNFDVMPELHKPWGYPMALALMLGSGVATWLFLRWKRWL